MKNSTLFVLIFSTFMAISAKAATLTVNNANPSPGQYTTIAAAMTAAANGDTLLIQGTVNNYGNVTITKPLTLRGTGWSPIYKQNTYSTVLDGITLAGGLNGVVIEGINFSAFFSGAPHAQYNITIQFCQIRDKIDFWHGCHDWLIRNNYFSSTSYNLFASGTTGNSNLIAHYNVFSGTIYYFSNTTNVLIEHNLFISPVNQNIYAFTGLNNALICANNIFYGTRASGGTLTNCSFSNNLTYLQGGTNPMTANGVNGNSVSYTGADLQNVNPLFTTKSAASDGFSISDNYRLQSSSLGKTAGTDGKDLGIYSDVNVFSLTGEPETPAVRKFQILNTVTTSGSTLTIKMEASKARRDGGN